jgi:hypothetical protein
MGGERVQSSINGYVLDYQLLALILGLVTAGLTFISTRATARLKSLEAKLEKREATLEKLKQ